MPSVEAPQSSFIVYSWIKVAPQCAMSIREWVNHRAMRSITAAHWRNENAASPSWHLLSIDLMMLRCISLQKMRDYFSIFICLGAVLITAVLPWCLFEDRPYSALPELFGIPRKHSNVSVTRSDRRFIWSETESRFSWNWAECTQREHVIIMHRNSYKTEMEHQMCFSLHSEYCCYLFTNDLLLNVESLLTLMFPFIRVNYQVC